MAVQCALHQLADLLKHLLLSRARRKHLRGTESVGRMTTEATWETSSFITPQIMFTSDLVKGEGVADGLGTRAVARGDLRFTARAVRVCVDV